MISVASDTAMQTFGTSKHKAEPERTVQVVLVTHRQWLGRSRLVKPEPRIRAESGGKVVVNSPPGILHCVEWTFGHTRDRLSVTRKFVQKRTHSLSPGMATVLRSRINGLSSTVGD